RRSETAASTRTGSAGSSSATPSSRRSTTGSIAPDPAESGPVGGEPAGDSPLRRLSSDRGRSAVGGGARGVGASVLVRGDRGPGNRRRCPSRGRLLRRPLPLRHRLSGAEMRSPPAECAAPGRDLLAELLLGRRLRGGWDLLSAGAGGADLPCKMRTFC